MTEFHGETLQIPVAAANKAFEDIGMVPTAQEIPNIPGFHRADTYWDAREADSGRIPALFLITRISDGRVFAAGYDEAADDNFYTENPFLSENGMKEFREVAHKRRIVTEEYYEFV